MKNCLLLALVFLLALPSSWAQPTGGKNQPTEKLETIANDNLQKYDTWNALDFYKQVYERKADDPKAAYDVAYTYYLLRDYSSAEEWFKTTIDKDKDKSFTLARWFYAYNMKLNGKYAECIPEFEQFISEYDGDQANLKELANIEIAGAKWAQSQNEPYEELKIENVGKMINSPLMENYAYPVGRNKIIFSSLRSDTIILLEEAEEDEKYAKIYMIEREANEDGSLGEWKEEAQPF
jgi:tetratricopeptide (TPR) repeat protein